MKDTWVINPNSVDFRSILSDINSYVGTHPDSSKWDNYFSTGVGQTMLELIAGMASYFEYQSIVGRREAYFQYAQNRSSLIGASQYLGYSVFRGDNPKLRLTVLANTTISLERFDLIGTISNYDLLLLNDITLVAGTPITFDVVVGLIKTESLLASSSSLGIFRFIQVGVSEELSVKIDDQVVTVSKQIKDLDTSQFIVITNPYESVDLFSLNPITSENKYIANSVIELSYVELQNVEIDSSKVTFNYGSIIDTEILSLFLTEEKNDSIKLHAPLYFETQFIIRARNDVEKIVILSSPKYIDAKGVDVSLGVIDVSILKADLSTLNYLEVGELTVFFESIRQFGMMPPSWSNALRVPVTVGIDIVLLPPTPGTLAQEVSDIIQSYSKQLDLVLDFEEIEMRIEDLGGVKVARAFFSGNSWSNDFRYQMGETLDTGDSTFIQQCGHLLYKSGTTEPVWALTLGQNVEDNRVIWVTEARDNDEVLPAWEFGKHYNVGDYVIPVNPGVNSDDTIALIDDSPPNFLDQKYFVLDVGDGVTLGVIFDTGAGNPAVPTGATRDVTIPISSGEFAPNIAVILGPLLEADPGIALAVININDVKITQETSGPRVHDSGTSTMTITNNIPGDAGDTFMYKCINNVNLSGATEPIWPKVQGRGLGDMVGVTFQDNDLLWTTVLKEGVPTTWTANVDYSLGDIVEPSDPIISDTEGLMFQVANFLGLSGATEPTWPSAEGAESPDYQVMWVTKGKSVAAPLDYNQYYLINEKITTRT